MRTYTPTYRYEYKCDGDCTASLAWTLEFRYPLSDVDVMARSRGWSIGKRHLCPKHKRGA